MERVMASPLMRRPRVFITALTAHPDGILTIPSRISHPTSRRNVGVP
jgi:hypothetical protein